MISKRGYFAPLRCDGCGCLARAHGATLHANLVCRPPSLFRPLLHLAQESGDSVGHQLLSPCAPTCIATMNEPGQHAALPCYRRILCPAIGESLAPLSLGSLSPS